MRRAVVMLVALCGVAGAEPARKVEIITEPPGATIYLVDLDSGIACQPTPCKVSAPTGKKTSIIARMDGFAEEFGVIDLRHGDVKRVALTLTPTTATLVVEDPGFAGGEVKIDDIAKGRAPVRIPLAPEGHHVVVVANGKTLYDDFISPAPQEEFTIKPKPIGVGQSSEPPAPHNEDENPIDNPTEPPANVTKSVELGGPPPEPRFSVGLAFEVGFRQFRYSNPTNLPPTENEGGQILIGPAVQIWPARIFRAHHLRGLSLYAKAGFGANSRPVVQAPDNMPTGATTFWGNLEIDLQHRWNIGQHASIEIGGGYVRDQLQFGASLDSQLADVPDVDYQGMRLGVRGALRFGPFEPYLQVEARIPFSEHSDPRTDLSKFEKVSVSGGGGAIGFALNFHYVQARLEASLIAYSWSMTNSDTAMTTADGARDVIEGITAIVGGSY